MYEAWRNYNNAPQEGAIICSSLSIQEGKAHCLNIVSNDDPFPVIVTRNDGEIYCYVNICPHQYLPLNYRTDNIISSDTQQFLCSAHGAAFDIKTGLCLSDCSVKLDAVPVFESEDKNLCIGSHKV